MANKSLNFKDFYIKYKDHPKFISYQLIEDDIISVIVQKLEMILFTNKGELYGDPFFGGDLLMLLNETKVSAEFVETELIQQINTYIPEISNTNYSLEVQFTQDPENYQDMMFIYFQIADYKVYAQIGSLYNI